MHFESKATFYLEPAIIICDIHYLSHQHDAVIYFQTKDTLSLLWKTVKLIFFYWTILILYYYGQLRRDTVTRLSWDKTQIGFCDHSGLCTIHFIFIVKILSIMMSVFTLTKSFWQCQRNWPIWQLLLSVSSWFKLWFDFRTKGFLPGQLSPL